MPMQAITEIYGISNCDTVRKARKWLDAHAIEHQYIDFRKDGLTYEQVSHWADKLGIDILLNRRGTTWRALDEETRNNTDPEALKALVLQNPALIKRPVLQHKKQLSVGFDEDHWLKVFQK